MLTATQSYPAFLSNRGMESPSNSQCCGRCANLYTHWLNGSVLRSEMSYETWCKNSSLESPWYLLDIFDVRHAFTSLIWLQHLCSLISRLHVAHLSTTTRMDIGWVHNDIVSRRRFAVPTWHAQLSWFTGRHWFKQHLWFEQTFWRDHPYWFVRDC